MVYFFISLGLLIVSLPLYFIGRKFTIAFELIIPIYVIVYVIIFWPLFFENPRKPKRIVGAALLQANNFSYICNLILLFFFTSHYSISTAGRALIHFNCLNISFRRWLAGDSQLLPVLFNWVTTVSLLEIINYTVMKNKLDLFLDKCVISKQE